jgi:hypothetical protein
VKRITITGRDLFWSQVTVSDAAELKPGTEIWFTFTPPKVLGMGPRNAAMIAMVASSISGSMWALADSRWLFWGSVLLAFASWLLFWVVWLRIDL